MDFNYYKILWTTMVNRKKIIGAVGLMKRVHHIFTQDGKWKKKKKVKSKVSRILFFFRIELPRTRLQLP
jgi:hypothetical protein